MDYELSASTFSFSARETRQCVNVAVVNDVIDEPEERFGVTLERTPDLNNRIILDPVNGEIFIQDDGK